MDPQMSVHDSIAACATSFGESVESEKMKAVDWTSFFGKFVQELVANCKIDSEEAAEKAIRVASRKIGRSNGKVPKWAAKVMAKEGVKSVKAQQESWDDAVMYARGNLRSVSSTLAKAAANPQMLGSPEAGEDDDD